MPMARRRLAPRPNERRRGLTTPMVAVALLVAMLGIALIIDRLWLSSAKLELTAAAEAAAFAAGRELAVDARLTESDDSSLLIQHARDAATEIASQNLVAGGVVTLDPNGDDVRFVRTQASSVAGQPDEKIETDRDPTEVWIRAQRTRFRGNPVALFMRELTRKPFGDVAVNVSVRLNNHIVGIRPFEDVAAPILPLGIWKHDSTGQRKDTWQTAIEDRQGKDHYGYDAERRVVTHAADGIPELCLVTAKRNGPASDANMQLLDLGNDLDPALVEQQILSGVTREQLEKHHGELRLNGGKSLAALPQLASRERTALEEHLGSQRIVMLYDQALPAGKNGYQEANCVEFVAIRVLAVNDLSDGRCQVIVQPTVMTTRMAIAEVTPQSADNGNRYLYRLELNH